MNTEVSAERVARLLERAMADVRVVLTPRENPRLLRMDQVKVAGAQYVQDRLRELCLAESSVWQTYGPGVDHLLGWVKSNWATSIEARAPEGTIAFDPSYMSERGEQLSAMDATKKLIVAAAFYGSSRVGKCAAEFTGHGLIETREVSLLKGLAIDSPIPLDKYCTLVPYATAVEWLTREAAFIDRGWPQADSVCAFMLRRFEDRVLRQGKGTVYGSPLLKHGPAHLALLLSLVWGYGLTEFSGWRNVSAVTAATLPFTGIAFGSGGSRKTELVVEGWQPTVRRRPLAVSEVHDLAEAYSRRSESTQRRLQIAMRRLRDSMTRIEEEDVVIDQGIALEALFGEMGERRRFRKRLSSRGSWYYADSQTERHETRTLLQEFYDLRSRLVHGGEVPDLETTPYGRIFDGIRTVLQASTKSMIADGRPTSWDSARGDDSLLHDPPQPKTAILSDKGDSSSWSLQEREEIDRQLNGAWKLTIADLPERPAIGGGIAVVHGFHSSEAEWRQRHDIPYVIVHPALLYMAHPKWPKRPSDELDERTLYYCERDVERHLLAWKDAALANSVDCFMVKHDDAEFYHPRNRDHWPQPLK